MQDRTAAVTIPPMPPRTPYANAPIVEALLDIRCAPSEGVGFDAFEAMKGAESERYPVAGLMEEMKGQMQANLAEGAQPPFATEASRRSIGYSGASREKLQGFQATIEGFTFSRLKPYLGWEAFRQEARRLWEAFRQISQPRSITRVAIRTINRLELPGPAAKPGEYLKTLPLVAEGAGTQVQGLFMQVVVAQPDIDAVAIITESTNVPATPDNVVVLLDIDLWRANNVPQDEAALWSLLETMRDKKDDIFEACITDKMRERFHK